MTSPGGPDEELIFRGKFDDEQLTEGAKRSSRSIDDLGDNADQATRRLAKLQAQADRTGESLTLLAIKERAAGESFSSLDEKVSYIADEYKRATTQVEQHTKATDKNTKTVKKSEAGFKTFMKTLSKTFSVVKSGLPIVKTLGMAWAAASAIVGAASLVQPVLQTVVALSSMAAYTALLPSLFGALGAIMLTTKLAISGVGDAISAAFSGDFQKLDAAIAQLSPNAAMFVLTLAQWAPALKSLRGEVQDAFFGPMLANLDTLLNSILPPLSQDMTHLAGVIGALVAHVMTLIGSAQGIKVLGVIFDNASHLVDAFSKGLDPVFKGFGDVIIAVGPTFNQMTTDITGLMDRFGTWLSNMAQSGKLTDMLASAKTVAHDLWQILEHVFSIFTGVVTAAGQGKDPLTSIATALGNVATWINTISGQNSLLSMFTQISQVANALNPVINMLITQLLPAILPVIATLVTTLSPIVVQLGQIITQYVAPAITQIIQNLGPGLQALVQAIGTVFQALAPVWGPLATAISAIVIAVAPLLGMLAQLLAPLLTEMAAEVTLVFKAIQPFIQVLADLGTTLFTMFVGPAMQLFQAVLPLVLQVFDALSQGIEPLKPLLADMAKQFASQVTPELMKLVPVIANQLIPALVNLAQLFGKELIRIVMELIPQMPQLTKAFIDLIDAAVKLFIIMAPYIPQMVEIAARFIEIGLEANVWMGVIYAVITAVEILTTILQVIIIIINAVKQAHDDVSTSMHNFGDTISGVWNNIANIVKNVVTTVGSYIQQFKAFITDAKNVMTDFLSGSGLTSWLQFLGLTGTQGRWTGGPVGAGTSYMVGELGPEKYIDPAGGMKDVGLHGPEMMSFNNPGLIIPNHMLNFFDSAQTQMVMQARAIRAGQEFEQKLTNVGAPQRPKVEHHTTNEFHIPVTVNANNNIDFEASMKKVIDDAQRDADERRQFGG